MRTVGILGGMGPEATVELMRRVIAATPARDDADHVPLIVDQNPAVPSRIAHLIEGTGTDPGPVLAAMARRLEIAGAEALAMPCNTAHHYLPRIREAVTIPLLDMVDLSVAEAAARTTDAATDQMAHETALPSGPQDEAGPSPVLAPESPGPAPGRIGPEVGILGSPAIRLAGVFDAALQARGLRAVWAPDQDALLRAIREIKIHGANEQSIALLRSASDSIAPRVQIIACTEFSLIAGALPAGVTAIDTLDVLARAIIRFATRG